MFLFYVSSSGSINIPVNAINLTSSSQYPAYIVSYKESFFDKSNLTLTNLNATPSNAPSSSYFRSLNGVFMP